MIPTLSSGRWAHTEGGRTPFAVPTTEPNSAEVWSGGPGLSTREKKGYAQFPRGCGYILLKKLGFPLFSALFVFLDSLIDDLHCRPLDLLSSIRVRLPIARLLAGMLERSSALRVSGVGLDCHHAVRVLDILVSTI